MTAKCRHCDFVATIPLRKDGKPYRFKHPQAILTSKLREHTINTHADKVDAYGRARRLEIEAWGKEHALRIPDRESIHGERRVVSKFAKE